MQLHYKLSLLMGCLILGMVACNTPSPEITPTATAISQVVPTEPLPANPRLEAIVDAAVYDGPGEVYPVVGELSTGQSASIIGRSLDNSHWVIPFLDGRQGWIRQTDVIATDTENVLGIASPPEPEQNPPTATEVSAQVVATLPPTATEPPPPPTATQLPPTATQPPPPPTATQPPPPPPPTATQPPPPPPTDTPVPVPTNTVGPIVVVPPYTPLPPYPGNCSQIQPGQTCLVFPDNYIWLVNDVVIEWRDGTPYEGNGVRIAVGAKNEYHHVLNTYLVWINPIN